MLTLTPLSLTVKKLMYGSSMAHRHTGAHQQLPVATSHGGQKLVHKWMLFTSQHSPLEEKTMVPQASAQTIIQTIMVPLSLI
ncbi:hypothetical protein EMIT091MI3_280034 [Kosakonia quasisacchari]